ncbi:YrrS family protein [Metabacillus herbersteinensis]|uniref:YrrS family protein n=1 Tax=Metabacillus herbersteinensis TaxID=283816 RepID=A0ABV6G8T1_9BACI
MSKFTGKSSRFEKRDKRRKTNVVLNTLIAIVVVLIGVIGSSLFFGGNNEKASGKYNEQPEIKLSGEQANKESEIDEKEEESNEESDKGSEEDLNNEEDVPEGMEEDDATTDEEATITEGDPNSNVEEVIENPAWEPVGTSQSGQHTATYDKGSQDWAEMTKALSSATGISESDMIIWFLGNNGSPNDAAGTISPKDKSVKYKVHITWVENQGWKPVKVEKLR